MRRMIFGSALLALSACGNAGTQDSLPVRLYTALTGGAQEAMPVETPGFTAEALAAAPQNFMALNVPSVGINQPARLHTRNGLRETWQAQGGATVAFDNGIMVATRGMIDDLLTMSSAGVRPAIAAGGGSYTRVIEGLDPQDQLITTSVDCNLVSDGVEAVDLGLRSLNLHKYTETCQNSAVSFQNAYWLDGQGQVMQSRQFVSVAVGYIYANKF